MFWAAARHASLSVGTWVAVGGAGQDRTGQVLITGEDRDGWTGPATLASSDFCFGAPLFLIPWLLST